MDFNSLFRKFFHINPDHTNNPFSPLDDEGSERNDDAMFHDNFESFDPHMFQQMEDMLDMLNKMFTSSFGIIDFPTFDENVPPQATNPRSIMIKDPEEEACDTSSCNKDFGESVFPLYEESGKELLRKSHSFSYSKFSSIKTVHLPDGTVEEHRTVINNDGGKTTTVRRTIGDISHEVITKSDKQGIKEKEENFMNMDEKEISRFEERWNKLKNGDTVNPVDAVNPEVPSISVPESSPTYLYILKKFFNPFRKDELKWI